MPVFEEDIEDDPALDIGVEGFKEDEEDDLVEETDGELFFEEEEEAVEAAGADEEDDDEDEEVEEVAEFRQALEADEPQIGASDGFRTDRVMTRFERARIKAARVVSVIHGAVVHPSVPEHVRRLGIDEIVDYELDHRLIPLCIERTVETKRGIIFKECLRLTDMDVIVPSQRLSWWMRQPLPTDEVQQAPAPRKARKKAVPEIEDRVPVEKEAAEVEAAPVPKKAPPAKKKAAAEEAAPRKTPAKKAPAEVKAAPVPKKAPAKKAV